MERIISHYLRKLSLKEIVETINKRIEELKKVKSLFVLNEYSISDNEKSFNIYTEYIEGENLIDIIEKNKKEKKQD